MLFVQLDLAGERDKLSSLVAFDCATGKQVWKVSRPVGGSWSTPAVIPVAAGAQLITMADPWVIAYDPKTGAELWRAKGLAGEVVTSPAFANGTLYIASDQGGLMAIQPDGRGDISGKVKRSEPDSLPDIVSPLAVGGRLLLITSSGTLLWFDPAAAKNVWTQDFPAGFQSSPILVGKQIYLVDKKGATHVFAAADEFKSLAVSPIGQDVLATPAFAAGRIFIRGHDELFCIAAAEATP
jgi:outer membrane protein assembly factor BamB